jgi:Tripartite tricarboxylate transporter family receptor
VIGTEMIARAPSDGYIIGFGNTNTLATNRNLIARLPYDSDFDQWLMADQRLPPG